MNETEKNPKIIIKIRQTNNGQTIQIKESFQYHRTTKNSLIPEENIYGKNCKIKIELKLQLVD